MTDWEPATEAETAMRDALRANDQELYFRILARTDLLLPVSAEALAGQAPMGWGTWTTSGRTHVLAFTSAAALRSCLGENAGSSRRTGYADLAADWPNHEWWLAVNPGLPIEGYLPAWFVSQLSRGDVRLPGRTIGARARLERAESVARARATAVVPGRDAPVSPAPNTPNTPDPSAGPRVGAGQQEPPTVPAPAVRPAVPAPTVPPTVPIPPAAVTPPRVPEPARAPVTPPYRPPAETTRAGGLPSYATGVEAGAVAPDRSDPADSGAGNGRPPAPATSTFAGPTGDRPDGGAGWPAAQRRRPAAEDAGAGESASVARPGDAPTDGRPGGAAERPANRSSFFEPVSGTGRGTVGRSLRSGERAGPPSRLGRDSQPFPRRRPMPDSAEGEPTDAFGITGPQQEDPRVFRPQGEAARAIGPQVPAADDRNRRFPATGAEPAEDVTRTLPRRRPIPAAGGTAGQERTQPLPDGSAARTPPDHPVDGFPPSIAEPVSGPPPPRRGFSPIVIEGTIVESRDLPDPAVREPAAGPGRVRPPAAQPAVARSDTDTAAGSSVPPVVPEAYVPPKMPPAYTAPAPREPSAWHVHAGAGPAAAPATTGPDRPTGSDRAAGPTSATSPTASEESTGWSGSGGPTTATSTGWDGPTPTPAATAITSTAAEPVPTGGPGPGPADGRVPAGDFQPANEVEEDLLGAAGTGSTDTFLSTLLLARVLLPVAPDSAPGSRPGDPGFVWRTEELDGETYVVVYTSPERLADSADPALETVLAKFVQLIRRWPDDSWSFAVNPGTPVGAKLPGEQIVGLANWAAEVGLGDDAESEPEPAAEEPVSRPRYAPPAGDPSRPVVMQKAVAPSQLAYYLERGYDRVSGFVHRANELAHLNTPAQLHRALGLGYSGSLFAPDAEEIYVLRWPAHRPSLYRIPYGGQNEGAMRAMEGWVIERPPFRGNGFAPGESSDVVAEFKVDSARLPHGAQLWRIGADGTERVVAVLDTDALVWRQVGDQ